MDIETIKEIVRTKGYAALTTAQKEVYNNSLSLPSATPMPTPATNPINTPTPSMTLPPENQTAPTYTLPQTSSTGTLVDFKNAVSQAVELARNKRNELMTKFMMPFQGTVAASDFSSILSNLNTASDKTMEEYTKNLIETQTPKPPVYDTFTMDGSLYEVQKDSLTHQIIGTPRLIQKGEKTTTGDQPMTSEDLSRFKWTYGWTPPVGFTWNELIQFQKDNPTATPEELEWGAKEALAEVQGKEITRKTPDEVITYIFENATTQQLKKLKELGEKAGTTGWFAQWVTGKEKEAKNYLNSIKDKIQTAIDSGYSEQQILEYLTQ